MLGQAGSISPSSNRVFVYEVTGLKQNDNNDGNNYSIRSSDSVFVQVPYSRMNEEMRRLTRMGGKIVGICSVDGSASQSEE
jgi:phycocyanin-associated rod protein